MAMTRWQKFLLWAAIVGVGIAMILVAAWYRARGNEHAARMIELRAIEREAELKLASIDKRVKTLVEKDKLEEKHLAELMKEAESVQAETDKSFVSMGLNEDAIALRWSNIRRGRDARHGVKRKS